MRKGCGAFFMLVAALLAIQPALALAESPVRIVPAGTVSLWVDGQQVNEFKSEMPLPPGLLVVSKGSCAVQSPQLQLVARQKTAFGLAEAEDCWNLTVNNGYTDFTVPPGSKPITIHTPTHVIRMEHEGAQPGGLVRGFVLVDEKGVELGCHEGALKASCLKEVQFITAGHSFLFGIAAAGAGVNTCVYGIPAPWLAAGGAGAIGAAAIIPPITPTPPPPVEPLSPFQ